METGAKVAKKDILIKMDGESANLKIPVPLHCTCCLLNGSIGNML
jgi:hypothetical protein